MNCPRCGSKVEKEWSFCPRCGNILSGDFFGQIFSRMRKEIGDMNKLFDKDIEAFDLSPWFRDMEKRKIILSQPKSSGFTIKIVQSGGSGPKVSVRTFGDVDKEKLKKEINELGVWQPEFRSEMKESPAVVKTQRQPVKEPSRTEEPKTSVKRSDSSVLVDIELPGVKSENDITFSELENSLEVKAFAGDKAYFKILTKPQQFRLVKKEFSNGRLHMEFS